MITTNGQGNLRFLCDACDKPVTGERGWLHVDMAAINATRQAIAEWKKRNPGPVISGGALLDYPAPAPWMVHHKDCDPFGDTHNCYWFYVGRASTWPRLVHWTAHLMGKSWFEHTDWQEVLERIGEHA